MNYAYEWNMIFSILKMKTFKKMVKTGKFSLKINFLALDETII